MLSEEEKDRYRALQKKSAAVRAKTAKKKKRMFIAALDKYGMNISAACKDIGINRATYNNWVNEDEEFKTMVDELNEATVDFGESCLRKIMKDGNPAAIIFFLKTKGRNRGYIEIRDYRNVDGAEKATPYSAMTDEEIEAKIEKLKNQQQ